MSVYDAEPETLDVIAVGAHPDDVEIGCGGTLALLAKQGYQVGIVDLTDGEPTPRSPGPEVRLQEAAQAGELLGIAKRVTLKLPNRRLFDNYESRVELAKVFRRFKPKLVLGIAGKTPMASPDHWQAMQITDAAIFYSRLTKWDEEFDHLPVHTIPTQVWYPLGLRRVGSQLDSGSTIMTDISSVLEIKLKSVRAYATQFPPEKERVFNMIESQNRAWGAAAGVEAAEMLFPTTPVVVSDLVGLLQRSHQS